jgi:hypothetical protein
MFGFQIPVGSAPAIFRLCELYRNAVRHEGKRRGIGENRCGQTRTESPQRRVKKSGNKRQQDKTDDERFVLTLRQHQIAM